MSNKEIAANVETLRRLYNRWRSLPYKSAEEGACYGAMLLHLNKMFTHQDLEVLETAHPMPEHLRDVRNPHTDPYPPLATILWLLGTVFAEKWED